MTVSPLYLSEGDYFLDDEFVAADGAFEGDGRLKCSYKYCSLQFMLQSGYIIIL